MRRTTGILLVMLLAGITSTRAETPVDAAPVEIEFTGYVESDADTLFSLVRVQKGERRSSPWLKIDGKFEALTIARFDRSTEVLWVHNQEGTECALPLKKGTLAKGGGNILAGKATIVFEGQRQTIDLAAKLNEALEIPLGATIRGKASLVIYASRLDGDKLRIDFSTTDHRSDVPISPTKLPTVVVLEGKPFAINAGALEFRFLP